MPRSDRTTERLFKLGIKAAGCYSTKTCLLLTVALDATNLREALDLDRKVLVRDLVGGKHL